MNIFVAIASVSALYCLHCPQVQHITAFSGTWALCGCCQQATECNTLPPSAAHQGQVNMCQAQNPLSLPMHVRCDHAP